MKIKDTHYVGVNDKSVDLFEGQYIVPNGMAYNSYIVADEKIAVFDTVDEKFTNEWLSNIDRVLGEREPQYLVVSHMESDHSAGIAEFMKKYKSSIVVATDKAFKMMNNFFGTDYASQRIVVKDGDTLSLGKHSLTFVTAPMVHWPEVMVSYDSYSKTLFSADAFGKFCSLDTDEEWTCEARRYYFGIVGKYGVQVQQLLNKAKNLDIEAICPLHGPVIEDNISYYIDLYNTWSSYGVESEGVVIAYTSVYGGTKKAVEALENELKAMGCPKVVVNDLARCDMAEAVEDAFRYGKLVLATTTYNGDIFPFMTTFIDALLERAYQKRFIGIIENGSWAPVAGRKIKESFEKSKDIVFADTTVTLNSVLKDENNEQIKALANELLN